MGFNFNFFGTSEHRVFNYKPRYYDPEKEELKKTFGQVDGTAAKDAAKNAPKDAAKDAAKNANAEGSTNASGKSSDGYTPGSYVKGSFRDGNYQKTRTTNKAQQIIGMIGLILFFIVLAYITKFYTLLW